MKLRLSADAYAKMLHLAKKSDKEVGGWGIAKDEDDPLYITNFILTEQEVTGSSIDWDSDDIAAFRKECREDHKMKPDQYLHIHCHTHPGASATPSVIDWDTLQDIFMQELINECNEAHKHGLDVDPPWMVMLIIAKQGECTAHIAYYIIELDEVIISPIGVEVEMRVNPHVERWDAEYKEKVSFPIVTKHESAIVTRGPNADLGYGSQYYGHHGGGGYGGLEQAWRGGRDGVVSGQLDSDTHDSKGREYADEDTPAGRYAALLRRQNDRRGTPTTPSQLRTAQEVADDLFAKDGHDDTGIKVLDDTGDYAALGTELSAEGNL